jgi:hypothetical protein
MKKTILFFVLLFSAVAIAQSVGWTDLMETDVTVADNNYDIFTNGYGNHIIVQKSDTLKYYKIDVEGDDVSSTNLETTSVVSPSISGDATNLYVVYRKGTEEKIRTKYSSDGGTSWSYISDLNLSDSPSSIECVFSKEKLHVTYQVGTTVYFTFYNTISENWLSSLSVSNTGASNPRIGINSRGSSIDTVYFVFQPGSNKLSWRRYNVDDGLSSIKNMIIQGHDQTHLGFAVDDEYIYAFHKATSTDILNWQIRRIWNNGTIIGSSGSNNNTDVDKLFTTTTVSGETCTAAWDKTNDTPPDPFRISRMRFNGNYDLTEDLIYQNQNLSPVNIVNLSSAENDVHVVWLDNLGSNNGDDLRFKYYDDVPLAPQDLDVEIYTVGLKTHPKLTWTQNNAPDVYFNSDGYDVWRRISENGGPWTDWSSIGSAEGKDSEYLDETIGSCYGEAHIAEYKIKAVDINDNVSGFSDVVSINFVTYYKLSQGIVRHNYELSQNYPNPFNPTTQISYSIAEDAFITLKIYDMLGNEVTELVNSNQSAGNYKANFNAAELSSGIYIYRLTAMNGERILFSQSNRMILLK